MKQCALCGKTVEKTVNTPAGSLCVGCLQKAPKGPPPPLQIHISIDDSPIIGQKFLSIIVGRVQVVRAPMNEQITQIMTAWVNGMSQANYEIEQLREDVVYLVRELGRPFPPPHISNPELECSSCSHQEDGHCTIFRLQRTPMHCLAYSSEN